MGDFRSGKCPFPGCKIYVETDYRPFGCADHREQLAQTNRVRIAALTERLANGRQAKAEART